jgi:hypothetical protein
MTRSGTDIVEVLDLNGGPKHKVELLVQAEKMKGSDRTAWVGSTSQHPAVLDGLFNDCYIIRESSSITICATFEVVIDGKASGRILMRTPAP